MYRQFTVMSSILFVLLIFSLKSPVIAQSTQTVSKEETFVAPPLHIHYSGDLGLTGCFSLGNAQTLLCLGWLDNAVMTCFQWGKWTAIAACVRRQSQIPETKFSLFQIYQGRDVLPIPANYDWGYRFDLTLP